MLQGARGSMQSTYSLSHFGWDGVQVVRLFEIGTGGGPEQHRRLAWFKSLDKRLTSYDIYVTLEHIKPSDFWSMLSRTD